MALPLPLQSFADNEASHYIWILIWFIQFLCDNIKPCFMLVQASKDAYTTDKRTVRSERFLYKTLPLVYARVPGLKRQSTLACTARLKWTEEVLPSNR